MIASIRTNPFQMKKIIALFIFLVQEKLRSEAKKNLRERERERRTVRVKVLLVCFWKLKKASEKGRECERGHAKSAK